MRQTDKQPHPEVIVCDYKGIPIRFRVIDDSVYVPVADLSNFLMCRTFDWKTLFCALNTISKVIFYKNGKCLWAIEPPDILPLCKIASRGYQKENIQSRIEWLTDKMYELKKQQKQIDKKIEDMNNIQILNKVFEYNGCPVTFCSGDNVMINATEMAKPFGKRPAKWLELPSTKEFLSALQTIRKSDSLIQTAEGKSGGTWMHEDVAIEFARWLSPQFAIWCNDRIKELLKYGVTATDATIENLLSDPDFAIRAFQQIKEERQKRIEAEEANKLLLEANTHQEQVIEGLVSEIPLTDMRQRITQIVRKGSAGDIGKGYRLLYSEFNYKFHVNVFTRMNNALYKGSAMDYIEKEMNKLPDLYDLACKLFESTYEDLMESWGKSARRAEHQRNLSVRQKYLS